MNRLRTLNSGLSLEGMRGAFAALATDLREKRLWPLAAVLALALVAVPLVLAHGATPPPAPVPAAVVPPVPAPVVAPTPSAAAPKPVLPARHRDPFAGNPHGATARPSAVVRTTVPQTAAASGASGGGARAATAHTAPSGPARAATPATARRVIPAPAPRPAPVRPSPVPVHRIPTVRPGSLAATDAYHVAVAVTDTHGGFATVDPVARFAPLPSAVAPALVELGVLQGGRRVLFAVRPGTVVAGPGSCIPGPVDCQILSLAPNQIERIDATVAGATTHIADFAVTALTVEHHSTAAVAAKVRGVVSAVGRKLLAGSAGTALSLFRYQPGTGTVADLRNLSS